MRLFTIKNTANFMTGLLSDKEVIFDQFLLSDAIIVTGNTFTIDGHINKAFYSENELLILKQKAEDSGRIFSEEMVRWESVKSYCFSCIKGKNTPLSLKISFSLAPENVIKFLKNIDTPLSANDINSLNLNIKYDGSKVTLTTAVSLKIFTMNKTIEHSWDDMVAKFLVSNNFETE